MESPSSYKHLKYLRAVIDEYKMPIDVFVDDKYKRERKMKEDRINDSPKIISRIKFSYMRVDPGELVLTLEFAAPLGQIIPKPIRYNIHRDDLVFAIQDILDELYSNPPSLWGNEDVKTRVYWSE